VLLDPDSAPLVFALSELVARERRITWWYPEVVVGPTRRVVLPRMST